MRSDDMITIFEPAWPHHSVNFQIVNAIIAAYPDEARFGSIGYAQSILERFRTLDPNERAALAGLLIAIRAARPELADQILKMALDTTAEYLDGQKVPLVVAPALAIASQTFTDKPPTAEDLSILRVYFRYILPLLGGLHYISYHAQLSQIIDIVVKAVPLQAATVTMKALLGHFPLTRSNKAIEFLRMLTFVLTKVPTRDVRAHMREIFLLFAGALAMGQVKLAAAACPVWNRIELEPLIIDNARLVFGIVYPILTTAMKETWSPEIVQRVDDVFRVLNRIDSAVFQDFCRGKGVPVDSPQDVLKTWASIARTASKSDKELRLAEKLFEIQKHFSAQKIVSFKSAVSLTLLPKSASTPPAPEPLIRKPVLRNTT
jgi:hypothetical protein